jgi:hypothetical protein
MGRASLSPSDNFNRTERVGLERQFSPASRARDKWPVKAPQPYGRFVVNAAKKSEPFVDLADPSLSTD